MTLNYYYTTTTYIILIIALYLVENLLGGRVLIVVHKNHYPMCMQMLHNHIEQVLVQVNGGSMKYILAVVVYLLFRCYIDRLDYFLLFAKLKATGMGNNIIKYLAIFLKIVYNTY